MKIIWIENSRWLNIVLVNVNINPILIHWLPVSIQSQAKLKNSAVNNEDPIASGAKTHGIGKQKA